MVSLVCENCSTPLPVGSRYCSACGTPVPADGVRTPSAPNGGAADLQQALQIAASGEYEIHHELGRGGMGSVFLGREIGLDRLVAIKVLPPSLMWDASLVERFEREARMVAKLHHPNIIPVYRVHHANELLFYTMHYVPGRTLTEIMKPGDVISIPQIEQILLEAAAGLGYAHARGVIHRDVKPGNILIDGEDRVNLTDFGIAKALAGNTHLTETGAVIGTPQYMPPEQCEGRVVDGRADQYSLAIVGYQMLAGHCPFESDSMKELLYHHLFTPPTPLNDLRPEAPAPLRDALHKALSKDPVDRFDSMEDFRAGLEGKGPPIFVNWLDVPVERPAHPVAGDTPRRRIDDLPTTQPLRERRKEFLKPEREPWDSSLLAGSVTSHHRQAMGALVVTAITVAVVAALALANGARVSGKSPQVGTEDASLTADLSTASTQPVDAAKQEVGDAAAARTDAAPTLVEPPAPTTGLLLVRGDLPAGATLELDGEPVDRTEWAGRELELAPGTKTVRITAAGFQPFERALTIEAGATAVIDAALERMPPPVTVSRDSRPRVPRTLLDELQLSLRQGAVFRRMGRYAEAAESYRFVISRVDDFSGVYRDGSALTALRAAADSALKETRRACEIEKEQGTQPSCP